MPWDVRRNFGGCKGYAVVKEDGEVVGCHATRGEAEAQMRALYAAEADKNHDDERESASHSGNDDIWNGRFIIRPPRNS